MMDLNRKLVLGLIVASLAGACSDDEDSGREVGNNDGGLDASLPEIDASLPFDGSIDASGYSDATTPLSDPEVLGVLRAINSGEIAAGMLAQTKASNAAVRDYATAMVAMHQAAQERQNELATPVDSAASLALQTQGMQLLTMLQGVAEGAAFDRAYLESQIAAHDSALKAIDLLLLPNGSTQQAQQELLTSREAVQMHLTSAQVLLSSLLDAGVPDGDDDGGV